MPRGHLRPLSDVDRPPSSRPSIRFSGSSFPAQSPFIPDLSLEKWSNYIRFHLDGDHFDLFASEGPLSSWSHPTEDRRSGGEKHATRDVLKAPRPNPSQRPTGSRLIIICLGLCLGVFCVALDNTIIATAIPYITDQFKNLNDVGWYGSVYLLMTCSFQLFFGKLYKYFNIKWIFLMALLVFETGSLICAVAPNSTTLIQGRAIAGLGSAGIFSGAMIIIAHVVPKNRIPMYISMIGGMYGMASIVGPLVGGAFTVEVTWRWCFYINLPIGGFTSLGLLFFLRLPHRDTRLGLSSKEIFWRLDPIGTLLFVPSIICLLLALQWAGHTYAWRSWRIIFLFTMFGVLLIAFIGVQMWQGEAATVPPRVVRQRSVAFGAFFAFCIGGTYFTFIYYLPIWFQAIKGVDALHSGINTLPMVLANVFGVVSAGALTTRIGYYMPWIFLSLIFMSVGAGLITTFKVYSSTAHWIGYQILFGIGSGLGFQQTAVAAQTVLELDDVPVGTAFIVFIQLLGGAMFVSIAQNLFTNNLVNGITAIQIPDLNASKIVGNGATRLRQILPARYLPEVLAAYNAALVKAFHVGLVMACLSVLGAIGMEWRSVKDKKPVADQ